MFDHDDDAAGLIRVLVCYALPDRQFLRDVRVPHGATLHDAVLKSGLLEEAVDIDLATAKTGIHGKLKPGDAILRRGDRVEIYRPLLADPKETRRRRARGKV